ncbi:hypothetical protein ACFQDJ_08655 [Pseudomonas brassicacearum]
MLQQLLQLRDLFADGALGQVQLFGGTGKAQVAGHRFEALQRRDRRQIAFIEHDEALFLVALLIRSWPA